MYINSNMVKKIQITIFVLSGYLLAGVMPENGATVNYTQLFFQWDQMPSTDAYHLYIQNSTTTDTSMIPVAQNSIIMTLEWNTNYSWWVCSSNINIYPNCSNIYNFTINSLPEYFPDNITISTLNESLYQEGITVMDIESLDFSVALDKEGQPVWYVDKNGFTQRFTFSQFLENGNLVGFGPGKGYEIELDGNIVFQTPNGMSVHHQISKTSHNTYFLISATVEEQYCPEECNANLPDEIPWQGDIFRELDAEGNELWSWNTFDYYELNEYNPYYVEVFTGQTNMDWTHSNSVFYDENSQSIFISARNLSRITKINYANKDIVWNMGETDFMNDIYFSEDLNFSQQHSVQVLDNGNLLFFDNHRYLNPELSRCIEVAYDESDYSSEIVWEYELPIDLFTGSRGECDRLDNGNTLITVGRTGYTLEVTPNHEIAWELHVTNNGFDVTKYRSARIANLYPVAFSLGIDELVINNNNNNIYVEPINQTINTTIYNSGWAEGNYIYRILDTNGSIALSDSIFVPSYENIVFSIDTNTLTQFIYTIEVYPSFAPNKIQILEFTLNDSIYLGDMNEDGILNILDIVILANLILSSDNSNISGDLNGDGIQNILDLVILVNIILER